MGNEYAELINVLQIYVNCEECYENNNACAGCKMPTKTNTINEYQRECTDFADKYAPLCLAAITALLAHIAEKDKRIAELEDQIAAAVSDIDRYAQNRQTCGNLRNDIDGSCSNSSSGGTCNGCRHWYHRGGKEE